MKISRFLLAAAFLAMGAMAFAATAFAEGPGEADTSLTGLYLEARTADVYAGHCYANSEVGLDGEEAVLAWNVSEGTYEGVELSGLSVVAVVKAQATLGDPHDNPYPVESVLIVDEAANADQRSALIRLAHDMGGELLDNVRNIRDAPVAADFESTPGHAALSCRRAGGDQDPGDHPQGSPLRQRVRVLPAADGDRGRDAGLHRGARVPGRRLRHHLELPAQAERLPGHLRPLTADPAAAP